MVFQCPRCDEELPTRVLADPVTLVVLGHCAEHGVVEVSRVYVGEPAAYPDEPVTERPVAYKPGSCCGRRLGEEASCRLPLGHDEEHAA